VAVLINTGAGNFASPLEFMADSTPSGIVAADLDGDGNLDLALANSGSDNVSVLLNNGGGGFLPPQNFVAGSSPRSVTAADLDLDGDLDLVIANSGTSEIAILKNEGNALFTAPIHSAAGTNPIQIAAVDLDVDGDLDLVVANNGSQDFSVLTNEGDGTYDNPVNYTAGILPLSVTAADFDGDGYPDVACACSGSNGVSIRRNNGDGTLGSPMFLNTGSTPNSVAAADLDMDGDFDLAVSRAAPIPTIPGFVSVLKNDGAAGFAPVEHYGGGPGARSLVIADLSGDGDQDLAVANLGGASISILENNGDGVFSRIGEYEAGTSPNSIMATDLNLDCFPDIATSDPTTGSVFVLTNDGAGNFGAAANFPAGGSPTSIVAADLDRDGVNDLAVVNDGASSVSVLHNKSDGTYSQPVSYFAGFGSRYLIAADCDGEDGTDLIVGRTDGHVSILLNNGDGTLQVPNDYASGDGAICAADFNRDGDIDLASLNPGYYGSYVAILTNKRDGSFVEPVFYSVRSQLNSISSADLDNNGYVDLVVAGYSWGSDVSLNHITVLLNDRDGTFTEPVTYEVGIGPHAVISQDFDSDGSVDLAAIGTTGDLYILRNDGRGVFGTSENFYPGSGQMVLLAADFDGNGCFDLGLLGTGPSSVTVMPNCGLQLEPTVSSVNDHGPGTLRSAITYANLHPGPDTITFAVSGGISLTSPLPPLADHCGGTVIQGFTAPGSVSPWVPTIRIGGDGKDENAGLTIESSNNIVEGVAIYSNLGAGVAVSGGNALFNTITACQFYNNQGPGIDLADDGMTENDPTDDDAGPNELFNFPIFDSVSQANGDTFTVFGTASPYSRIELFLAAKRGNPALQPEETAHGPAYLLLDWVAADADGQFDVDSIVLPEWSRVTATATDTLGNTSELAKNKLMTPDPLRITAYSEAPPLSGKSDENLLLSPAVQVTVIGPVDEQGRVDTIGPAINTFGTRATYDSLTDYNGGGLPDARIVISSPDTGLYNIIYTLVGSPGEYLSGIGIDGHAEVYQTIEFVSVSGRTPSPDVSATYHLAPPTRGELTGDDIIQLEDIMTLVSIVFFGGGVPNFEELSDVDCDGLINAVDLAVLIDYVCFAGHPPCD